MNIPNEVYLILLNIFKYFLWVIGVPHALPNCVAPAFGLTRVNNVFYCQVEEVIEALQEEVDRQDKDIHTLQSNLKEAENLLVIIHSTHLRWFQVISDSCRSCGWIIPFN